MVVKASVTVEGSAKNRPSDAALETSRLLVEFLHAAYATRHSDSDEPGGDGALSARGQGSSGDVSTHAVRAAIHVYQHGERTVGQLASGLGISYGWANPLLQGPESTGPLCFILCARAIHHIRHLPRMLRAFETGRSRMSDRKIHGDAAVLISAEN